MRPHLETCVANSTSALPSLEFLRGPSAQQLGSRGILSVLRVAFREGLLTSMHRRLREIRL